MSYEEAIELAYQVKWKTTTCGQGESCWCRGVDPEVPINYSEGKFSDGSDIITELHIASTGELYKEFAEYFVELHNKTIEI